MLSIYKTLNSFFAVTSDPFNITLSQTSATSVIVEWSQPSGGATVTGYVVHYSDGVTNMTHSVPASSTSCSIVNLTSGNYHFSVEATSEHLSGESGVCTIRLGNVAVDLNPQSYH